MALGLRFQVFCALLRGLDLGFTIEPIHFLFCQCFALLALASCDFLNLLFFFPAFLAFPFCCLINSRFAFTSAAEVAGSLGAVAVGGIDATAPISLSF